MFDSIIHIYIYITVGFASTYDIFYTGGQEKNHIMPNYEIHVCL